MIVLSLLLPLLTLYSSDDAFALSAHRTVAVNIGINNGNSIDAGSADASVNIPSYERYALHDLYRATNGSDWNFHGDEGHWNFTDPNVNPCSPSDQWQGLNCTTPTVASDYRYQFITKIQLSSYFLVGTIPESIGNLYPCYVGITLMSSNSCLCTIAV